MIFLHKIIYYLRYYVHYLTIIVLNFYLNKLLFILLLLSNGE